MDDRLRHNGCGVPLVELRKLYDDLGPTRFVDEVSALFLIVNADEITPPQNPGETMTIDPRIVLSWSGAHAYPLRKLGVNEFPHITIGRTRNNDVWIWDASLSKFHAYVKNDAILDAGSNNGTLLDTAPVPARGAGEAMPLTVGAVLSFGGVHARVANVTALLALIP